MGSMLGEPESGTALGEVLCHCSEDDGIPDVGVSVGLGGGKALWIGELLTRDGGDIGIVFHGPNGQRIAAPMWPNCEWQEAADLLRRHVGPALAAYRSTGIPADPGREQVRERINEAMERQTRGKTHDGSEAGTGGWFVRVRYDDLAALTGPHINSIMGEGK